MKHLFVAIVIVISVSSCRTTSKFANAAQGYEMPGDTLLTQSLFNDRSATISEENIQKILDGRYALPQQLRLAIVRLDMPQKKYYWNDEEYLKTQQAYLNLFGEKLKQSSRVAKISIIPDLLISKTPSFTSLREAAVRLQEDIVVAYAITSDIYSKYKLFTKPDVKAFATTQMIMLDVRTGLVPFSTIVTKDYLSQKLKEELDHSEVRNRVQNEAVLLTIEQIGKEVTEFLK